MIILIYALLFSSVIMLAVGIGKTQEQNIYLSKIAPEMNGKKSEFKILAPVARASKFIVDKLKLAGQIKPRLEAAKIKLSVHEFFAFKIVLLVILAVLTIGILGKADPLAIIFAVIMGYILPDLWIKIRIKKRKEAIARVLPETIDLLGLCIEAGLDFMMAIKWVIEKSKTNPFLEELALVSEEIKWGKPRTQALREMAKRLNIPEVSSFVQTLVQADRLGTSVSETFTILSEDTRQQRFRRGERIALKAPMKILIPLIFFILPVIAIIVGGPILLQFATGQMFSLGR